MWSEANGRVTRVLEPVDRNGESDERTMGVAGPERRPSKAIKRHGIDRAGGRIAAVTQRLVPAFIARRAVTVSVEPARERIAAGESLPFRVTVRNRLPVAVAVPTPTSRVWSWSVDGLREATESSVPAGGSGTLRLLAGERRRIDKEWNGLLGREVDGRKRWVEPEPGGHELAAWIGTDPPCARDTVRIDVE